MMGEPEDIGEEAAVEVVRSGENGILAHIAGKVVEFAGEFEQIAGGFRGVAGFGAGTGIGGQ
jgi:hypothetical protein